MRPIAALLFSLALAGCVVPMDPATQLPQQAASTGAASNALPPNQAARNFVAAVGAVEPVAEQICRARTRGINCDFRIVVDDTPNQPPNAFQTLDDFNRPILAFNLALIANARNVDELAFVIGHEAAHHIAGHIPQQQQSASQGALLAGILVAAGGGDAATIQEAQKIGATVGARRFSKGFELEADALGTEITERAGFDALRGAAFFDRLPDPGNKFLGTHPPNADRRATVARAVAALR
ncbi:M48 family metallopeptidase [Pseudorhodobacter ferrugineus]|uniref:M48 family metallopeptidase n=1 Tax=Pseudorhodobacter ferrugineus TaxID=77008 RepID=UPI0003B3692A|nr:M48 family metallopeptidase [Pseudorhodobacter ferrugineus]